MFSVGQYVVHKTRGACQIKEQIQMNGGDYFLLISMIDESFKIYVPISLQGTVLRDVLEKQTMEDIFLSLQKKDIHWIENNKLRKDAYLKNYLTGDFSCILETVVALNNLKKSRISQALMFSRTDEEMLEKGTKLLSSEIALAYHLTKDESVSLFKAKLTEYQSEMVS